MPPGLRCIAMLLPLFGAGLPRAQRDRGGVADDAGERSAAKVALLLAVPDQPRLPP